MPQILDEPLQDFTNPQLDPVVPERQFEGSVLGAAARQENDVVNFVDMLTRPRYPAVPDYNVVDDIKKRGLLESPNVRGLLDSSSPEELDWRITKNEREQADRDQLYASGWGGVAAQIGMGALSPTSFIPFLRAGTGVKSVIAGGLNIAAGAGAQELVLYQNQQTRTKGEVAFSLAASTILGSILGAVAHTVGKSDLDKWASDMVASRGDEAISPPTPFASESSVGAREAVRTQDAGSLKQGLGAATLSRLPITQNPIIRGLQQWNAPSYLRAEGGSPQVRKMTAGFGQAGLTLDKNVEGVAAAAGGNVETLKTTYSAVAVGAKRAVEDAYVEYVLGAGARGILKKDRAIIAARAKNDRLSYEAFKREVTLAIWNNFPVGTDPHVLKAAKHVDEKVYKSLYKEATEVGIFTGEEEVVGDLNYANRVYNHNVIMARHEEFVTLLADNYKDQLQKQFSEGLEKIRDRMQKDKQQLEDMARPLEEAKRLKEEIELQRAKLDEDTPPDILAAAEVVKELRREVLALRQERKDLDRLRIDDLEGQQRRGDRIGEIDSRLRTLATQDEQIRSATGTELASYQTAQADMRRRLYNLAKANAVVDARLQRKLSKIEKNEDAQIATILRANKKLTEFTKFLDSGSDAKLDAELARLKNTFEDEARRFDKLEEKLVALEEPDEIIGAIVKQEPIRAKMDDFAERIESLDAFDRQAWRAEIADMMKEFAEAQARINAKRVIRNEKLWKQVEGLSPEVRAAKAAEFKAKVASRKPEFVGRWQNKGEVDFENGVANFDEHARQFAEDVTSKILGVNNRLAYSDIIKAERGAELARLLHIPSTKIKDFLETDIERLVGIYGRTVGSDVAIARVFGSADAADEFTKLKDERNRVLASIDKRVDKKGEPLTPEAKEKLSLETHQFYDDATKDLYVLLERAKGIRGLGKDPDAIGTRMAKAAMDLNYLRYMGGTVVSSVADIARPIMKYGLSRVLKDGFIPLIKTFKEARIAQHEAVLAGVGNDLVAHTHLYNLADVFDDAHRGTIAERGLHYAATRFGQIAFIDQWNTVMKQFTGGLANAKLLDSIQLVMEGGAERRVRKATEFLAKNNIDAEIAEVIWKQVTNGKGGGKVRGVWLPNTEFWDTSIPEVARARRAYRAALVGEVNSTIVTPGFERPSWVDSSVPARVLAQFQSFGFSSTQRTLMAGLQEHDAAFFQGVTISLAFGAMSYWLWAHTVGGTALEKMQNADLDKWADEAITRSGVIGVFDQVQRIAQRIPAIKDYASFSGGRTSRREGGDLVDATMGPSMDLLEKAFNVAVGVDEPTKSTLHSIRQMLPFQNLFYFRQILDAVEQAAGTNLPERRSK